MHKVVIFGALTALFFLFTPATPAQDAEEVAKLRRENELLKKEIELLKREIELLKKEAKAPPDGAGQPGHLPRRRRPRVRSAGAPRQRVRVAARRCGRGAAASRAGAAAARRGLSAAGL